MGSDSTHFLGTSLLRLEAGLAHGAISRGLVKPTVPGARSWEQPPVGHHRHLQALSQHTVPSKNQGYTSSHRVWILSSSSGHLISKSNIKYQPCKKDGTNSHALGPGPGTGLPARAFRHVLGPAALTKGTWCQKAPIPLHSMTESDLTP